MKKIIKALLYNTLRFSGFLAIRDWYLSERGKTWCTVLLYHKVDPDLELDPSDINIHPKIFQKQMNVFADRYNVISVAELLEYVTRKRSFPPRTVCITFDDSYRSIYEHALPILIESNLPACFFINDGYLDSDRTYPWDEDLNRKQKMMSWTDAKEVMDSGFEIGVHTTNHLDLAILGKDRAQKEINGSQEILNRELGVNINYFSIPFGGKENYTQETIDIVKDGDFNCCFSAYGGFVDSQSDIYNLERMSFSNDYWSISEFLADIDRVF